MKYFVLLKSFNQIFGLQNDNIDGIIEKKQLKDMHNDEAKEFMTKLFHRIDNDKSGIELFFIYTHFKFKLCSRKSHKNRVL